MPLKSLLFGFLAPLAISAMLTERVARSQRRFSQPSAWGAYGLAVAYCASQWGVLGFSGWPPRDCVERLADGVLGAALLEITLRSLPTPRAIGVGLRGAFFLALAAALVQPLARNSWSGGEAAAWIAGLTICGWIWLAAITWAGSNRRESPLGGLSLASLAMINLAVVALGSAIVLGLSGSATLALLQTALLLALLPQLFLALRRRSSFAWMWESDGTILTVALLGAWIAGYHYATMPAASAISLWLAPLAGLLATRFADDSRPARLAGWVCGVNLVLVGVAIVFALRNFEPPTPGGYDPGNDSIRSSTSAKPE